MAASHGKVRGPQIVADNNKDDDASVTILIGVLEIIFYAESASDRTQLITVSIIALLHLLIGLYLIYYL